MDTVVNITRNHERLGLLADADIEQIDVDLIAMADYDTAYDTLSRVLGSDLGGPDVMRLVSLISQAFLHHHNEATDLVEDQYNLLADLPHAAARARS